MKIKRLNDYELTSGGYIFDLLDRTAQAYLTKHEPFYPYWLTASARIKFLRQSTARTITRTSIETRTSIFNSRRIYVKATLIDGLTNKPIAVAKFKFIGKNHVYKDGKK